MKFTKYILALALAVGPASASVVYDFSSLTPGTDADGYQGWTNTQPGNKMAYGIDVSGNNALAFGGASVTANTALETTSVTAPNYQLVATAAGQVDASVSLSLFLVDSTNDISPTRDTFSFTLTDSSGSTLVSLYFNPRDQSADPDGTTAIWDLSYDFNDGTGIHTSGYSTAEGEVFSLTFGFNTTVAVGFGSGAFAGVPTAYDPNKSLGDLIVGWAPTDGAGAGGDNVIVLDNVTFVPEPSAALLGAVGALGLFRRRRA